jgi:hypothetical protein
MENLDNILNKLQEAFKSEDVKKTVLDGMWYKKNKEKEIDSIGFCFFASEVIYRLTGGKERWTLKRLSNEVWPLGLHYFLYDKMNGKVLDVTADQYGSDVKIPYELAKGRGLRCKSKRAILLAKCIGFDL